VDSNQVFIDGLEVPVEDRIGDEGRGFEYILHGMNPERILIAAEAIGLAAPRCGGRRLRQGAGRVWSADRAESGDSASACRMLDGTGSRRSHDAQGRLAIRSGHALRTAANAAKYLGAEAGFKACQTAIMTHGGTATPRVSRRALSARKHHPRIAPVTPHLILCFIAGEGLGTAEIVLRLVSLRTSESGH